MNTEYPKPVEKFLSDLSKGLRVSRETIIEHVLISYMARVATQREVEKRGGPPARLQEFSTDVDCALLRGKRLFDFLHQYYRSIAFLKDCNEITRDGEIIRPDYSKGKDDEPINKQAAGQ